MHFSLSNTQVIPGTWYSQVPGTRGTGYLYPGTCTWYYLCTSQQSTDSKSLNLTTHVMQYHSEY